MIFTRRGATGTAYALLPHAFYELPHPASCDQLPPGLRGVCGFANPLLLLWSLRLCFARFGLWSFPCSVQILIPELCAQPLLRRVQVSVGHIQFVEYRWLYP